MCPFENTVPPEKRDTGLKHRLSHKPENRRAVLAWAVAGCLAWQREGLNPPESVKAATEARKAEADPLTEFLTEWLVWGPDHLATVKQLRDAYQEYVDEMGLKHPPTWKEVCNELKKRDCVPTTKRINGQVQRVWRGVGIISWEEEEPISCNGCNACNGNFENFSRESGHGNFIKTPVTSVTSVTPSPAAAATPDAEPDGPVTIPAGVRMFTEAGGGDYADYRAFCERLNLAPLSPARFEAALRALQSGGNGRRKERLDALFEAVFGEVLK